MRVTNRSFWPVLCVLVGIALGYLAGRVPGVDAGNEPAAAPGWQPGKGWGWIWGPDDEVGALNAMTDASRLHALRLVRQGKVYDLGVTYTRDSYKWPGHNPGEIISFRTPEGLKRQLDLPDLVGPDVNPWGTAWHSNALFISDNVATQIDSLAHATEGPGCPHGDLRNHWYNGFTEEEWGGDFGPRKCDASTIPPIVARGVLIDVAAAKGLKVLPPHYPITTEDLIQALDKQGTVLKPGDVVLVRTGALQFWGEDGADPEGLLARHDSAGLTLEAVRWLVEQKGAMMIGADTSGVEYHPAPEDVPAYLAKYKSFMPVHNYLLIDQGVHLAEFHYLEDIARDKGYEFCYICCTNKIKGTTAGFCLRPIAIR